MSDLRSLDEMDLRVLRVSLGIYEAHLSRLDADDWMVRYNQTAVLRLRKKVEDALLTFSKEQAMSVRGCGGDLR